MPFDFKKEYKDLYVPKSKVSVVEVPPMTFFAVAGTGDPNEPDGAYSKALELLYGLSYTVKMSKMGPWQPEGYFDYVVPSIRLHHEIYLGDPRRTRPENLKTVIRHPIRCA